MTIVVPPSRPSPPIVVESQVGPDIDVVVDRGPPGPQGPNAAWGGITGTLSAQADLQAALDAKAAASHTQEQSTVIGLVADLAAKAPLASPTFTGTVTLPAGQAVNGVVLTTAGGTSNFLRADGTYAAPPGGGGGLVDGSYDDITVSGFGASVTVEGSSASTFYIENDLQVIACVARVASSISFEPVLPAFNTSYNIGGGAIDSGVTKTIAIGGSGLSGSTANISIGSAVSGALGTLTVNSPTVTFSSSVASISAAYADMDVLALGIGTAASGTHALNIAGQSSAFGHDGAGHTVFLNKAASGDTASITFQSAASTRGEIGLIGNNNLALRTSPDGSAFTTALTAASADGAVTLHKPVLLEGQASDPGSPSNGTLWYNSTNDDLKARVGGRTLLISAQADIPFLVPPTNEYIPATAGIGGNSAGTLAGAANRIDLYPYLPGADLTVNQLAVNCTTAVASAQGKIVVYGSDANGRPDALILETGTLDFGTTGQKTVAVTLSLRKGRTYWIGIRHSSTATLSTWPVTATPDLNGGTAISTSARKILRRTLTFATGAPSSWAYVSSEISAGVSATAIWMRIT